MLLPSYYGVWYVVGLLRRDVFHRFVAAFYLRGGDLTDKTNLISRIYQIMVVSMLKNWNRRYYNHYIIKFIGFISIYYAINLDIVLSFMVFSNLYLRSIYLLQV